MRSCCALLVGALSALGSASSLAQGTGLTLSFGADYSEGDFGTSQREETWALPILGKYETGPLTLRAQIPWIRRSGPGRPELVAAATAPAGRSTTTGWGDLVTSASYNLYNDRASGIGFDLTGKIKFGTADETKLLGTGENDYSIQGDVFKSYDKWATFATLGWRRMGDPAGTDFRNPWYASLGGSYRISADTSAGLAYDYRQRVITGGGEISELSAFVTQRLGARLKLQGYLVAGFADASPDWGGGALVSYGF